MRIKCKKRMRLKGYRAVKGNEKEIINHLIEHNYYNYWDVEKDDKIILFNIDYKIFFTNSSSENHSNSSNTNTSINETPKKEDIHISMSVVGDIMCHNSQYTDAYNSTTGTYDFSYVFENWGDFVEWICLMMHIYIIIYRS